MSRLIDADALMDLYANRLELLGERYGSDSSECGVLSGAMKLLEAQPTIDILELAVHSEYPWGSDKTT